MYLYTKLSSHATAAMIKAHGVAQDVGQCVEYLKQYKMLPKHDSNKRFNFVVYQAALDASILHLRNVLFSLAVISLVL